MSTSARLSGLRGLIRERVPAERCELCSAELSPHPHHEHLFEPTTRQIKCSCTPCAILFPAEAEKRYRRVSRRLLYLDDFAMNDMQWESLAIPVNMAFLHTTTNAGGVRAFYPSPAGATESMLSLEAWQQLTDANPVLVDMAADVEALLVYRRRGGSDFECFLVPIDACYELTGRVRKTWKGFDGGEQAWHEIEEFFVNLRGKCPESHLGAQP